MRRVRKGLRELDPETGACVGIFPQAFELRPEDKGALSVTWLEFFQGSHQANAKAAILAICNSMKSEQKLAVFAVGQVAAVKAAGKTHRAAIRVVSSGSRDNPAHSQILQTAEADVALLDELASDVFSELWGVNGKRL